jgi:hypothetical protein
MSSTFIWIPESEWAMAPTLICSAKATERRDLFQISIIHPNTKQVLYTDTIRAKTFIEALDKAKLIKKEQFNAIQTRFEEFKSIPRPKKGKMKLNMK